MLQKTLVFQGSRNFIFRLSYFHISSTQQEMKLELVGLIGFFEKGICKLIQGECYPNATLRQRPNE